MERDEEEMKSEGEPSGGAGIMKDLPAFIFSKFDTDYENISNTFRPSAGVDLIM